MNNRVLTVKDCKRLIGSLIGGLTTLADASDVREAIKWWAESDKVWELVNYIPEQTEKAMFEVLDKIQKVNTDSNGQ